MSEPHSNEGAHGDDSSQHGHAHAPGLPEIRDEAVDAPGWLPALAIGLLIAFIAGSVLTSKLSAPDEEPQPAIEAEAPAEAAPAEPTKAADPE